MNRKVVGIIPNESKIKLPPFITTCSNHLRKMKAFIDECGIYLYNADKSSIDSVSKTLTEQDYLVFLTTENETMKWLIVYVPEHISEKQLEYFERRKEPFKQYTIEYLIKQTDGRFEHKYQENVDRPVIEILMDDLKEHLTIKGQNKTLIKDKNK